MAALRASGKSGSALSQLRSQLLFALQAQYSEPLERVPRAWSRWAAAPLSVAGAVRRTSQKSCSAPGRRWPCTVLEPTANAATCN